MDFTEDVDATKEFISKVKHHSDKAPMCSISLDIPEDVQGGLN